MSLVQLVWNPYKENVCIMGASQEGKTELAKKLSKMLVHYGFNVIICDVHRKFTELDPLCVKHALMDIRGQGLEIIQPFEVTLRWFEDLCAVVYSLRNVVFVPDELHNFASKFRSAKNLELLARNCNNRNIGYMAIFQRPAEIPNFILSNANHLFCFRLDLPTDIDYLKKAWFGNSVLKFGDESEPIAKYHGLYKKKGEKVTEFST